MTIHDIKKISDSLPRVRDVLLRIARILKTFLFFSPADEFFISRKQISIALGRDFLSIAHGSRSFNRIRIEGFETYQFQEGSIPTPEKVASMASLYCRSRKLTHPQVAFTVPKVWCVIQTTELPSAAKENLSDVIAHEMDRITPFSSEEAFYDYKVLKETNGKLHLTILAVKKQLLEPCLSALASNSLMVSHVDTNLTAAATYLHYMSKERDFIYLDLASEGYEGGLFQQGVIVAGCAGSSKGDRADESFLTEVAGDIMPWIVTLKKTGTLPRLFVHSDDRDTETLLEKRLQIPMQILRNEDLSIPGLKGEKTSDEVLPQAVGGVLSLLWAKSRAMNVLSRGKAKSKKAPVALTMILLILLILIYVISLLAPLHQKEQEVAAIDRELSKRKEEIKKIESLRKEYDGLQEELNLAVSYRQTKPNTFQILKELTLILPKSVWLTRVRIYDTHVMIEGYASSAAGLLPKIEASPEFARVEFASPTLRESTMNMDRFVIRMTIEGMEKEEPKGKNVKKQ